MIVDLFSNLKQKKYLTKKVKFENVVVVNKLKVSFHDK